MFPAHHLVLLGLPKGCGEGGKDVLPILTGLNTSAGLLWDLWGVISEPQLFSSPLEISDVTSHSQSTVKGVIYRVQLLSRMMTFTQSISEKLKWGVEVPICGA